MVADEGDSFRHRALLVDNNARELRCGISVRLCAQRQTRDTAAAAHFARAEKQELFRRALPARYTGGVNGSRQQDVRNGNERLDQREKFMRALTGPIQLRARLLQSTSGVRW